METEEQTGTGAREEEQSSPAEFLHSGITNPLAMGICSIEELVERARAFRQMNAASIRQRYLLAREEVSSRSDEAKHLLSKGDEIDLSLARNLSKYLSPSRMIKTYQPDEGIVIISDSNSSDGASLTMEIYNRILAIGEGKYEAFIDVVESFADFLRLIQKALFPRLIVVGYISPDRLEMEHTHFIRVRRYDAYLRILEAVNPVWKPGGVFPRIKQVRIIQKPEKDSNKILPEPDGQFDEFQLSIIQEYTKPYFFEEF